MSSDFTDLPDLDSRQLRAVLAVLGVDVEGLDDDGGDKQLRARLCRMVVLAAERHALVTEIVADPGVAELVDAVDRRGIIDSLRQHRLQETFALTNWRARRLAMIVTELAELFSRGRHPEIPESETPVGEPQMWTLVEDATAAVADTMPVLVSLMSRHDSLRDRADDIDLITRRLLDAAELAADLRALCGLAAPEERSGRRDGQEA